ncbi:MAG: prepilin peptidase [Alphaproteobacteria bacterium]|nr:prepilin peptidase [Alphaproteobacteria bacterium]
MPAFAGMTNNIENNLHMSEYTLITFLKIIAAILVGGTLGSFAGVLLYRLPRKQSIIAPRSYCNSCKQTLAPRDLIPIASYVMNKGQCRFCHAPIGREHALIELLFIALYVLVVLAI